MRIRDLYEAGLNTAPTAKMQQSRFSVRSTQTLPLTAAAHPSPEGDPLSETWTADGGTVSGNHFTAGNIPGVYDVCLTVNDGSLNSEPNCTIVVIYDPEGGFVTGYGSVNTPAGAYYPSDLPYFEGSYYEIVFYPEGLTFAQARETAEAMTYGTCESAHCGTIASQEEYDATLELVEVWHHAQPGAYQEEDALVPDEGWQWVTGEPFDFEATRDWWLEGEPNDCGLEGSCPSRLRAVCDDVSGRLER